MHLGTLLLSLLQRTSYHGQALRYTELRAMRGVGTHLRKRSPTTPLLDDFRFADKPDRIAVSAPYS
jgi:hypothetical protein